MAFRHFLAAVFWVGTVPTIAQAQTLNEPPPAPYEASDVAAVLSLRAGRSSDRGGFVGLDLKTDRLFGRNQSLRLSAEVSESDHRFSLNYEAPDVMGQNPVLGLRAYYHETERGDIITVDTTSYGIMPYLRWTLTNDADVYAGLALSNDEISDLPAASSAILQRDLGDTDRVALRLGYGKTFGGQDAGAWVYDGRLSISQDFATRSGGLAFSVTQLSYATQFAHQTAPVRIKTNLMGGALHMSSGDSNVGERFFHGQQLVRGFAFGGIGPVDGAVAGNPALGGNVYVGVQLDLQFPSLISAAPRFSPGVFFDAGSVFDLDNTNGGAAGANVVDDSFHLRSSFGISVAYDTGIGEIAMILAHPLSERSYDRTEEVQISFGTSF